jgi:hypothetical protein
VWNKQSALVYAAVVLTAVIPALLCIAILTCIGQQAAVTSHPGVGMDAAYNR